MSTWEKCAAVFLWAILVGSHTFAGATETQGAPNDERLTFQTTPGWSPRVNLNADVAMVYGIDTSLPRRMQSWRDHGYKTWVMTGVAWGNYQDYVHGRSTGRPTRTKSRPPPVGGRSATAATSTTCRPAATTERTWPPA